MLVVTVIAVAYGSAAPQLAVAEFAPSARQAPAAPPTTQDGSSGSGSASRRSPTTTAPVTGSTAPPEASGSSAPTTRVGRSRPCFGTPPRQIEDLLAPACLATVFEGDNGGGTARGVSATEIRVGVPASSGFVTATSGSTKAQRDAVTALFEYANRHFEMYGRRLVPVFAPGNAVDAATSRAVATDVAGNDVFAAVTGPLEHLSGYAQAALVQELGRQEVVTVVRNRSTWWSDRLLFDPLHPYVWSEFPSAEQLQRNLGAVACSLAGGPAVHAGDVAIRNQPRRFAVVAAGRQLPPATNLVTEAIDSCSERVPAKIEWTVQSDAQAVGIRAGVARLVAEGITTIVCLCEQYLLEDVSRYATDQRLDPEWIYPSTGYWGGDEYWTQQLRSFGRLAGSIQIQAGPRLLPLQARSWFSALLETSPALVSSDLASLQGAFQMGEVAYGQILMLAAGVQAAGPALTPSTFAAGLMASRFPNPGAGQAPAWQPSVGFGPGDHSFYDDFAVAWWSPTAPAVDPTSSRPEGSWCYVGAGARFRPDSVPSSLDGQLYDAAAVCR